MDYEYIKQRMRELSDHRIKAIYKHYIYELIEELIPYTDFSKWYLEEMRKELERRGYEIKN
jgi:hypothetical protein